MSDELDQTLRDWSESKTPGTAELDVLAAKISQAAQHVSEAEAEAEADVGGVRVSLWSRVAYSALGAAAALVLVFAWGAWRDGGVSESTGSPWVAISADEVRAHAQVFRELKDMFPEQLRWVAQAGDDIGMGVDSVYGGVEEGASAVLIRIDVVSRAQGKGDWNVVWNTDVMTHSRELVEVAVGPLEENRLKIWVYPMEGGALAVENSMALETPIELVSRDTIVVEPGAPTEVMTLERKDHEYRVIQTVVPLDAG